MKSARLCLMLALCMPAAMLLAQATPDPETSAGDSAPGRRTTAVGVRQQHVQRMMQDLEQKFVDLARTLEKSEPGQAKRLIEALEKSKEAAIETRMQQIAKMLNESRFDGASDEQQRVVAELQRLIAILLAEESDLDKLEQERRRLERWKAEIERLIVEETDQKRESEKIANKDETLSDLEEQIAALENLVKKQQEVIERTVQARDQGVQALGPVADQQRQVRAETEELARKIGGPRQEGTQPAEGDAQPSDSPPQGENSLPGDTPGEGAPGNPASGASGFGEGNEGGSGGSDSPSQGGEGGESGAGTPAPTGSEPGQTPLEKAAKHQRSAEQQLGRGKGKAAEEDEKRALAELQRALDDLKKERRRIASLPPEAFDQMAKKQDETASQAGSLAEEMAKAAQEAAAGGEGGGQGGEGGEGGEGGQTGEQDVQQAQQSMQQASGGLKKKDPKAAAEQQKRAIEQLKKARQMIEERLAQLRREMQIEKLAALEARFQEMLNRQKPVTETTVTLDAARVNGRLRRVDRLTLAKQADEEAALAEMAQKALDIIIEDGTSIVFPNVVEQLRDDMTTAGELLRGEKTDAYTQSLQKEIELTLEELIAALQKAQQNLQSGGGSGGGGGGNEPLLPGSAELKLLKAAQLRVNRRTISFEQARTPGTELEPIMKQEIGKIARRQEEIARMAEAMVEQN